MADEWRYRWYRTADGKCPLREFLADVRKSARDTDVPKILALVEKVAKYPAFRQPRFTREIKGEGFWEVRIIVPGYRVFYLRRPGLMVLLDGIKKKSDKARPGDLKRVGNYRTDYLERCLDDEAEWDEELYA